MNAPLQAALLVRVQTVEHSMGKLKLATILVAASASCVCSAAPMAGNPVGAPAFVLGEPVTVVIRYDGGIEGWDGAISVGERHGEPSLIISNGAEFVLTRGLGEFVPEQPDSLGRRPHWQVLEGRHGRLVHPIGTRVHRCSYMIRVAQPFRTVVDLAQFYKIDAPGTYWVYWGMKGLWADEFSFEMLEATATVGTKRGE